MGKKSRRVLRTGLYERQGEDEKPAGWEREVRRRMGEDPGKNRA